MNCWVTVTAAWPGFSGIRPVLRNTFGHMASAVIPHITMSLPCSMLIIYTLNGLRDCLNHFAFEYSSCKCAKHVQVSIFIPHIFICFIIGQCKSQLSHISALQLWIELYEVLENATHPKFKAASWKILFKNNNTSEM